MKAFAGTGKSTLLKEIVKEYDDLKFIGIAFNDSIVRENKRKFPRKNSDWFTGHKLAIKKLKEVGFEFNSLNNGFKAIELIEMLKIPGENYELANSTSLCYNTFCNSSLKVFEPELIIKAAKQQRNSNLLKLPSAYIEAGVKYAEKLFLMQEQKVVPLTHNFYYKYFEYKEFAREIQKYDFLLLDEAQDSNGVTMSIVSQIPSKKIYVGDEHQSIYGFRGTLNAMEYAKECHYLSTTFRYSPEIANQANQILKKYKGETEPIVSKVDITEAMKDREFAYLTRNNSTMIGIIDSQIKRKRFFKTIKKPEEIFAVALALLDFKENKCIDVKENPAFAYLNRFKDLDEVLEYAEVANDSELVSAFGMQRRYGKRLYMLLKEAKNNYKSKDKADIYLATAHTSKGLEWGSVELSRDFPDINKLLKEAKIGSRNELMKRLKNKDPHATNIVQEINLLYVAITRAKHSVSHGDEN